MSSYNSFERRHIGPSDNEMSKMLQVIGVSNLDQLIDETVPSVIRSATPLNIPEALSESQYLIELQKIASKNQVFRSYIGQGYFGTHTPSVILRNVFQNPGWYTQYTPYQAEISQGRLEALGNFCRRQWYFPEVDPRIGCNSDNRLQSSDIFRHFSKGAVLGPSE